MGALRYGLGGTPETDRLAADEVGEAFADYRTEWNVRDAHHIEEGWRVEHMGGHLYTVVSVIPNIDRGFNTLVCERINE